MYPYVGGTRLEYRIFKVLSTSIRQRFRPTPAVFVFRSHVRDSKRRSLSPKMLLFSKTPPKLETYCIQQSLVFAWPAKDDYLRIRWRVDWKAKFYRKRIQFTAFCVELHVAGAIAACRRNRERSCVCSEIFIPFRFVM